MSLIARRFGPAMGGIILGLPWMTGPILFFLGAERGDAYLEEAARGVLMAVPAIGIYTLAYAFVARRRGWLTSLVAGTVAFGVTGWLISFLTVSASVIAALAVATLLATRLAIAQPRMPLGPLTLPWWDIPARMVATGALVGCITIAADYLGPTLLGIVSSFPVIMTVLTTFSHHRWGVDAAVTLLRSVMLSLIGFVAFFEVLALYGQSLGLVASFVAATVVGLVINVVMLMYNRWSLRAG
jgi:uncharacterized membrane protein (GlpM family)